MIDQDVIRSGDALTFQFKSHVFRCVVTSQGFLGTCTRATALPHRRAGKAATQPIFGTRGPFLSLTDWADTCIQEICHEYVTRFSSWKRCRHQASGQAMYVLRDKLQDSKRKPQAAPTHRQLQRAHEKIAQLQAHVDTLKRKIGDLTQKSNDCVHCKRRARPVGGGLMGL